ncbi:NAD(P)H-dependent FMN reductase [Aminobacter aminovorans]|uniref:NADPH azoreductase n=2 Tax=Aminobacter aminovorans TaxID=83263 RepID=A0A380WF88_AMIAI|nr:NAD(P)H-dependent FMN reductase [Aminobacter aminovorans]SUU87693.1 NADPH azoreductase [Aminobacter aminovorans]
MSILAISGSLRAASTNNALVAALARIAPPGCHLRVYDGLGRLPIFNPDDEGERTPQEVTALIDAVTRADGVIVSCPEYAHGVPGGLKNALDWLVSRDAAVGKPAMQVHASPRSHFARNALAEIMKTMSFDLFDGQDLTIALLGKRPQEMDEILADAVTIESMRDALSAFSNFVRTR